MKREKEKLASELNSSLAAETEAACQLTCEYSEPQTTVLSVDNGSVDLVCEEDDYNIEFVLPDEFPDDIDCPSEYPSVANCSEETPELSFYMDYFTKYYPQFSFSSTKG